MKNLSLILNVILIIAVGVLYFLHFTHRNSLGAKNNSVSSAAIRDVTIAYVIEDSLLNHYEMFKDMAGQLEKKRKELDAALKSRAQSLQTEIENYKATSGNMTINQAKVVEDDLVKKQQNLSQYQEFLGQQMMSEEAKVNDQLFQKVSDYLKVYAKEQGYNVVLNFKRGTGMLYGSDTLNITNSVIEGLNAQYKAEKGKPSKPDTTKASK